MTAANLTSGGGASQKPSDPKVQAVLSAVAEFTLAVPLLEEAIIIISTFLNDLRSEQAKAIAGIRSEEMISISDIRVERTRAITEIYNARVRAIDEINKAAGKQAGADNSNLDRAPGWHGGPQPTS